MEKKQVYHFKQMLKKAENSQVTQTKAEKIEEERVTNFKECLKKLEEKLGGTRAKQGGRRGNQGRKGGERRKEK